MYVSNWPFDLTDSFTGCYCLLLYCREFWLHCHRVMGDTNMTMQPFLFLLKCSRYFCKFRKPKADLHFFFQRKNVYTQIVQWYSLPPLDLLFSLFDYSQLLNCSLLYLLFFFGGRSRHQLHQEWQQTGRVFVCTLFHRSYTSSTIMFNLLHWRTWIPPPIKYWAI